MGAIMSKMGKAEIIERYGIEYYERLKERNRLNYKRMYDADPEKERARRRERYARNPQTDRAYNNAHRMIYRINSRDRNRLTILMHIDLTGKVLHHLRYHKDNTDHGWLADIMIMTPEEHNKWHREHPEFVAAEHIV